MSDEPASNPVAHFEYIKGTAFRVIHADGIFGGLTPPGNVHVAFYSERLPFPRKTTHLINPDGSLGDQVPERTEGREGIIRELDVDVIMSVALAEAMIVWLTTQVAAAKKLQETAVGTNQ